MATSGSRLEFERLSLPNELHPTSCIRDSIDTRLLKMYLEGLQTQEYPLMKQSPELIRIRKIEIPKLAFNNESVMSALLAACAAAQCMHDGTKTEYLFQEIKHRHNALASFRLALQKPVTSANRDTVLLTMILLTTHALFLNDDPESFQGLLSNSLLMVLSGARAIWNQIRDSMEDSVFYPLVQDYQEWKLQAFETDNTICAALHEMCNIAEIRTKVHTSSPLIESDQHMAALHLTIDRLKPLIQFSNASYPPRVMLYFVLKWPSSCPPKYLQLIEIGDPLVLTILAHYLACAQSIRIGPWPRIRIRSRCTVLCHHLRGLGMDKWIAWPESICSEELGL